MPRKALYKCNNLSLLYSVRACVRVCVSVCVCVCVSVSVCVCGGGGGGGDNVHLIFTKIITGLRKQNLYS